jgi:hypothetical protein
VSPPTLISAGHELVSRMAVGRIGPGRGVVDPAPAFVLLGEPFAAYPVVAPPLRSAGSLSSGAARRRDSAPDRRLAASNAGKTPAREWSRHKEHRSWAIGSN